VLAVVFALTQAFLVADSLTERLSSEEGIECGSVLDPVSPAPEVFSPGRCDDLRDGQRDGAWLHGLRGLAATGFAVYEVRNRRADRASAT